VRVVVGGLLFSVLPLCITSCCGQPIVVPASSNPRTHPENVLKILSWNVFLMPVNASPRNRERAAAIAQELLAQDFDILCLQKVFDDCARETLETALAVRYPHRFGPANSCKSPFPNSGVLLLSRIPLTDYHELQFDESADVEVLSRKGALMVSGEFAGHPIQIVATHLQGDDAPYYRPYHQHIRNRQIRQIALELLYPHAKSDAVIFVCGDFSTPRGSPGYQHLLTTLGVRNGPGYRVTLDDSIANDLAGSRTGRARELDYILVRENHLPITGNWERIIFRRSGWDGPRGRTDLSYRYAVGASFEFGQ
jgi:endonuclease/exonuclease/phosphatase family metal-dependent hydrolase